MRNHPPPALEALEDRLALAAPSWNSSLILVQFRPDVAGDSLTPAAPGTTIGPSLPLVSGLRAVYLEPGVAVEDALTAYRADSRVVAANPDYQVHVERMPNDPNMGAQWNLHNTGQLGGRADADIDAPEAWDHATGTGRTVVAVIDSGIDYKHPDLAANIWTNPGEIPGNGIDDDGNGYVDDVHGYDFANEDADPMDDDGHGTHIAGIIGAVGNNGIGVAGIDWNVKLMALKFLDANGEGYTSDAVRALNYAVAQGASISNHSWGDDVYNPVLAQAIAGARAAGHIVVVAAGNGGTNNDTSPTYPASYASDNVVVVAGTDPGDNLASFSNYGPRTVHLAAPAVNILSTTPGGYGYGSGTSMAAPHVTGTLALLRDQNPGWSYTQLIRQVLSTVDPVAGLRGRVSSGGRLNTAAALRPVAVERVAPRVLAAVWSGSNTTSLSKVRVIFSEPIQPATFTTADVSNFTGPGGPLRAGGVSAVPGSGNRQFDVTFAPQTAAGTYQMVVGPDITDLAGNRLDQDGDNRFGEAGDDAFPTSTSIGNALTFHAVGDRPVRDFQTTRSALTVPVDATIADLDVRLHLSHSQNQDLRVVLRSPWGQEVVLIDGRGGTGDNFHFTTLDDEAALSLAAGSPPFTGSFRPEQPLAAFNGRSARGTWELRVEDRAAWGMGTLHSWTLQIRLATGSSTASARGVSSDTVVSQAAAAIDDDDLPRDQRRRFRRQKERDPREVRRLAVSA